MRKINFLYILASAAVLFAVGCNRNATPEAPKGVANLTVTINGAAPTKAVGITDAQENAVNNLQVFVFDNEGAREAYGSVDNKTTLALSCKQGQKAIWAVVNCPSLESINSVAALKAYVVSLADNDFGSFVMVGNRDYTLGGTTNVDVEVNRVVGRILIKKITKAFSVAANQEKEFKIRAIYVDNAQGRNSLGLDAFQAADGIWYNKMAYTASEADKFLYSAVDQVVAASHEVEYRFYAMPNDSNVNDWGGQWSKRFTRLVIETELAGEVLYYPINIDKGHGFENNKSYEFEEIIITKKGSSAPDEPVTSEDISFTVNVQPWTPQLLGENGVYTF